MRRSVLSDSLTASSIGYKSATKKLLKAEEQIVNFVLERSDIMLGNYSYDAYRTSLPSGTILHLVGLRVLGLQMAHIIITLN